MIVATFLNTEEHVFTQAERDCIRAVSEAAEHEVRECLPQLATKIELVVEVGTTVIPETGETGRTFGLKRQVTWTVDPFRAEGVMAIASAHLRPRLIHELNHVVRTQGKSKAELWQRQLLDYVVSEGLATAFAREVGGRLPPWGQYPVNVQSWVEELLALPLDTPHQEWMFKHPDGRRWIGYKAGTYLVDQAIAASGLPFSVLTETPTSEIIKLAGFALDRSA
ncbi:MAG: DUF2268 domain-containing putative Zn-dependent protease [Phormidesmis sp.]